ncbi:MAG: WD40 repeat domain-containing protein [bacterium]|nr:WD40 repeat domain-containing protein [bacterium]
MQHWKHLCALGLLLGMSIPANASQLRFYAVDDQQARNSQLVYVEQNGAGLDVTEIGPTHFNFDIEGIDLHPTTGVMYAVGGEIGHAGGQKLYTWDTGDGSLLELGFVGGASNPFDARDIIASSFRNDGSYWVSIEDQGLYTVDLDDLSATLQSSDTIFTTGQGAEGLAWSADGSELYLGSGDQLLTWDPARGTVEEITSAATAFAGEIEALGLSTDGELIAAGSNRVYEVGFDVAGQYQLTASYLASGRDFESIAIPEPSTLALLAVSALLIGRRRYAR